MSRSSDSGLDWTSLKYKFYPQTTDQKLLFVSLLFALIVLIVLPLFSLIFYSFTEDFPVTGELSFTLAHYRSIFADLDLLLDITINSFIYAGGTTLLALAIGTTAATFVVKYVQSRWIQLFMLLPYGIPSVASLTGWILLLGNAGLITDIITRILGTSNPPYDIYSIWGMIFVEGIHTAPIAFLFVLPALRAIPSAMDDASFITGAGRLRTFRKVIIPVIWPSILSTAIFLFARTMATVATPSVLGLPAQIFTFGSAIPYLFLSGIELSYSNALSFSVYLTAISAILIVYYLRVQAKEGQYTTVSGRGRVQPRRYETSRLRVAGGYVLIIGYLVVAGILPLVTIIWSSLLPVSSLQLQADLTALTFDNYVALFTGNAKGVRNWYRALRNTLIIGLVVPTCAMTVSLLIAYANQTIKMPMGRLLSFLASLPLAIPGIARGISYLTVFIVTPIYGTFWILFIAFFGYGIPIGMRYASPSLTRIGVENAEASLLTGAKSLRTFRRIIAPLISEDFIAGWMHMFVSIVRNVSVPILLYSAGSEVIAVLLLNVLRQGYFKTASSIAVVIAIISLIPYAVLQYWRIGREVHIVD
jgi:iron(III) transport system permease protein